ncbi:MAG: CRISPR-associated helicase Cas3' [Firmicutes bacterium]|nr:CRISPR-associated helicase Cas3' [Bacillota bacterium]
MIVPLAECIARPPDTKNYLLAEHLVTVAHGCGNSEGNPIERLGFLMGLLHDSGKARALWQKKIRLDGSTLPLHSWVGAYLYALVAEQLWKSIFASDKALVTYIVLGVMDISDHHSDLGDVDEFRPPWRSFWNPGIWEEMDLPGLWALIQRFFPEVEAMGASVLGSTLPRLNRQWYRWARNLQSRPRDLEKVLEYVIRVPTARLIQSDRFDAADVSKVYISEAEGNAALANLEKWINNRQAEDEGTPKAAMALLRQSLQQEILMRFSDKIDSRFFSLELPTGMGKTICGLRLALHLVASNRAKRIIYVAPYLSILSQAADDIRKSTGLSVLEHHHLSALQALDYADKDTIDLIMESWQASVVATTFNQFFRAVLPKRAQQSMRLAALESSVIIIDEPQIFQPEIWHLLLYILKPLCEELDAKVLLMSATMPPLEALGCPVERLSVEQSPPARFRMTADGEPWDESRLADEAVLSLLSGKTTAVILNTIKDAVTVYGMCRQRLGDSQQLTNLHGAMTSLHKQEKIQAIRSQLRQGEPHLVISTQVIEAGVDLSFQRIYRARPILPSVIQAAGRANRHAEGEMAEVIVFDFLRDGEVDTRQYVYRNAVAREITDTLLPPTSSILEDEAYRKIEAYYDAFVSRYPAEGGKDRIRLAASGIWSEVGSVDVFAEPGGYVSVFVPYEKFGLSAQVEKAMAQLGVPSRNSIYEKYCEPGWMSSLDYHTRKQFTTLLTQFTVPAAFKTAYRVAAHDDSRGIWLLVDDMAYDSEVGLGASFGHEDDSFML